MIKNLPANAEDTGLITGLGRYHMPRSNWAHVPQMLSLCSGAWEPQLLKHAPRNKRSHCNEKSTTREEPHLPQLEKSPCSDEDPAQKQKIYVASEPKDLERVLHRSQSHRHLQAEGN